MTATVASSPPRSRGPCQTMAGQAIACPLPSAIRVILAAILVLLTAAAGGAGVVKAFVLPDTEAVVRNWTASPLRARIGGHGPEFAIKAGTSDSLDLLADRTMVVQFSRNLDGASCWAYINAGEHVVIVDRTGTLECLKAQGTQAGLSDGDLRDHLGVQLSDIVD